MKAGAAVALAAWAAWASPGAGQSLADPDVFLDPAAARLYAAAQSNWRTLDESVVRYTARIEQRIAAAIRTPLKDRVVYRNETAARAFWDRDYEPVVQVLGTRSRYPGRDIAVREGDLDWLDDLPFDRPFEPGGDRLLFGLTDPDADYFRIDVDDRESYESGDAFWFAHPLAVGADAHYRFRSGDTLTVALPDGRSLTAVQLQVLPREADAHRITGTLWIEPQSGALVRAVYRLSRRFDAIRDIPELQREEDRGSFRYVPGIFKPWTFDLKMIAVDYGLWDFKVWLPRSMRMEGEVAAGVLKMPVSMDLAYRIESVATVDDVAEAEAQAAATDQAAPAAADGSADLQEVHFETRAEALAFIAELLSDGDAPYELMKESEEAARNRESLLIVPRERSRVAENPHLPPPIWEEAAGFPSDQELQAYVENLAKLPAPPSGRAPLSWGLGWAGGGRIRYNRVEGLAAGGTFQAELGRRFSFRATGLLGLANLRPDVHVEVERSTVLRRLSAEAFHELRATDRQASHLGLGNTLNAFFFGADNGDYYRASGGAFAWRPPALARESYEFRLFGERQRSVVKETDFALFKAFSDGWTFRPNPAVDDVDVAGAEVRWAPWWGSDPTRPQLGLELQARGAAWRFADAREDGDGPDGRRYLEAKAVVRAAAPLSGGEWDAWRLGAQIGVGTIWGNAPAQRLWHVGGPATLRGHGAAAAFGTSTLLGRLEVARTYHGVGASVFGDAAWAGDRDRFDGGDFLYGVGLGASILDGLLRFDVARGLNGPSPGFRVHLQMDAIL